MMDHTTNGNGTVPHQWPPPVDEIGLMAGWCSEDKLDETRKDLHDRLIEMMGDMRAGPVEWRWFDPELAPAALDTLVEDEVDEELFNYYRHIRAMLREYGGLLVIATAPSSRA